MAPDADAAADRAHRAELAIRRTLAEYCQLLDDGRFDQWIQVFSEDVAYAVMGRVTRGRAELRQLIEPLQQAEARGRHVLSEPLITVDGDHAAATTDYCFVSQDLKVTSAGRYHDVLVDDGWRWRIVAREVVFLGAEPQGIPGRPGGSGGPEHGEAPA